jgi:hypothetical protein
MAMRSPGRSLATVTGLDTSELLEQNMREEPGAFRGHDRRGEIAVAEIRVYPNPSSGKFLEFMEERSFWRYFNSLGLKSPVRINGISDQLTELDLSPVGTGMYIINVVNYGAQRTFTVIIE